ncbi:MAG: DNA-binding response regulator [Campylobacterales bacterium]
MDKLKVLIIEDEPLIAHSIAEIVEDLGFKVCGICGDSDEALVLIDTQMPEILLADINIDGDKDGVSVCEYGYKNYGCSTVFITARADDETLSRASKTYPASYLVKPIDENNIKAALFNAKARLESSQNSNTNYSIHIQKEIVYDREKHHIINHANKIVLTKKESKLLDILLKNRGQIIPIDNLENLIWEDEPPQDSTRRTLIYRLNKKLSPAKIESVKSIGYRLR